MDYREATYTDCLTIATLHANSWRRTYRGSYRDEFLDGPVFEDRRAVWEKRLAEPPANQFVVAEEEGYLVGFACAYGRVDPRWGTLLDNIHVRPAQQRQGIGTALVAEVVAWCHAHYADCGLWLWVVGQNERARRFYERLGAVNNGAELRPPSAGGGAPREVHRYSWATLDKVRVGTRGSADQPPGGQR
ncbi:MAG TPA: GNAT family N-acetyltransferase [Chthonomonadaceae bacterium]|nr:GNAT family N-acetyltransferase [Chthonomonadaceae bacterium]